MKKMFTLMFGTLAAVAAFAAAPRPQVIVRSTGNYEVRIDGRVYTDYNSGGYGNYGNRNATYLSPGIHTVEIFRPGSGGLFGKRRKLISSQQFNVRFNDVVINVAQNGYTQITENRYNDYGNNRGRDNRDDDRWRNNNNGGYNNGRYPGGN